MGYWLKEIMKEDKTYGREHLLKIADEFLSRDERKLIREELDEREIEYKSRF